MLPIIEMIDSLPAVQSINFCDNRLTDVSLMPLTAKLPHLKTLTSLNLNENDIDESSATIIDYLSDQECPLIELFLDASDVDDLECAKIASAIESNTSIQVL